MAESIKSRKPNLQELLNEIAEDEAFTEEERQLARKRALDVEYYEWCSQQKKSNP